MFPRARGKLHWEEDVSTAAQKVIVHNGGAVELNEYIAANREELENELSARRDSIKHKATADATMPISHSDWLK